MAFGHLLETSALVAYLFVAFGLNQVTWLVMASMVLYTKLGVYLVLLYVMWIYMDRNTCESGGRRTRWFRNLAWWKYHRRYFPIQLHKTAELSTDRNYLFAICPHGVLSAGAYSAFGTDASDFAELFPGLVPYLSTLRVMFFLPVVREFMILAGLVSPSSRSLNWVLGSPGVGRVSAVVVGGAIEAQFNEPGKYKTVVGHRKGFCRLALQNGASIVPVVSFGEVDIYSVVPPASASWLHKLQLLVKNVTGILPIRLIGQGFLGLLPRRMPINVVVGSPIHVERNTEPSAEEVAALHKKFLLSLTALFESEKTKYVADPIVELEFVED